MVSYSCVVELDSGINYARIVLTHAPFTHDAITPRYPDKVMRVFTWLANRKIEARVLKIFHGLLFLNDVYSYLF